MSARKQFTPEFKHEAVQLVESGSRPASPIARELSVRRNQRYKWQTELRARGRTAFPGPGARKERTPEVAWLKRELARMTEERDILKKPRCTLPRSPGEVGLHAGACLGVSCDAHVSGAPGEPKRLLRLAASARESPCARQSSPHRTDARAS